MARRRRRSQSHLVNDKFERYLSFKLRFIEAIQLAKLRKQKQGAYKDEPKGARPGLVLLDLNMPGMDGRKTLEVIKQDDTLKQIPVIILTTSSDERDIQACYQTGANTYVQKPVSFDGLIEAIKRLKAYWFEIALLPKEAGHE